MKKLIVLVAVAFALVKYDLVANPFADAPSTARAADAEVVLFATAWCGYCKQARKLLEENGVSYKEYDLEKSSEGLARYKALNGNGVPLLVVNGDIIRGYDRAMILASLNK